MQKRLFTFFVTVAICILGFAVKLLLVRTIHYPEGGFLLSLGTIMVSAWYGGFANGILAVIINYVVIDWLFITPGKLFLNDSFVDQVRFTFFIIEGIFISYLFELLHKANRKINESLSVVLKNEKLSRSVIENIKDYALFIVDADGNITSWNKGAAIMTGYNESEVYQQSASILLQKLHKNKNVLKKVLTIAKTTGQDHLEGWAIRKEGTVFWAETVITSLSEVEEKNQSFSVIMHDITSRKKIEDLKSDFISIVAHELRTPVTSMQLILENMKAEFNKKNGQVKNPYFIDLINEVNRFSLLIDNILDITRLRRKKFLLNRQKIEMNDLISHIVKKMQLVGGKNHPITFSPIQKVYAFVDKLRIEQVLINLIDNAVKFSPEKKRITISLSATKSLITISIHNESKQEVPKNKQLLIFNKFFQLVKRPVRGFGLGLYISKEIVKQHKGKMTVISQKNKGITFSFSLPLQ